MRALFWLVLIVLVVLALRSKSAVKRPAANPGPTRRNAPGGGSAPSQTMVSCAQCSLYIPAPEAVTEGDKVFCCEQHRRQFFSRQ